MSAAWQTIFKKYVNSGKNEYVYILNYYALVSPIKCPAWQPILNPVYLKLEKLVICICGIAKFETGALYIITYNYIINDSSRM